MKSNKLITWVIGIGSLFLMSVILLLNYNYAKELGEKQGVFGDMFGASNALFTGLSFTGLIITILLQRQDLNAQRDELQKQTTSIHIQNFENTFFQMLNIFHNVVDSLEIEERGETIRGRRVFNFLNNKIKDYLFEFTSTEEYQERCDYIIEDIIRYTFIQKEDTIKVYDKLYEKYSDALGHYFRGLYHIVKFTDEYPDINKQKYISIARSYLSNSEQVLLYYNCLHPNGILKFKPLVEKYALLNNIDWSYFPEEIFMLFYNINAYVNEKP